MFGNWTFYNWTFFGCTTPPTIKVWKTGRPQWGVPGLGSIKCLYGCWRSLKDVKVSFCGSRVRVEVQIQTYMAQGIVYSILSLVCILCKCTLQDSFWTEYIFQLRGYSFNVMWIYVCSMWTYRIRQGSLIITNSNYWYYGHRMRWVMFLCNKFFRKIYWEYNCKFDDYG